MSVDTKKCRDFYTGRTVHSDVKADIYELCDEIDRLRKDLDFETRCMNNAGNTIKELQTELSQLREQLRPRSIKDEPPAEDKPFLAYSGGDCWCPRFKYQTDLNQKFWLPMPPAPPQTDAFEEWRRSEGILDPDRQDLAFKAWNAAIQSTKHEKT